MLQMKRILLFLIVLSNTLLAQNTDILGVVNQYTDVSSISGTTINVGSSASFSVGDYALLIQMQGATIDETNSASFGDVLNTNSAGNYELLTVCDILNATQLTVSGVQRTYDPSQSVQLIRVPEYIDATVTNTVFSDPWDGAVGGVVAIKCRGNLTMNANIDVSGAGFTGAAVNTSSYTCQWFINNDDYFYTIGSGLGGLKGEGIAQYITDKTAGRGAQANGGGGGNDHNSGGGGGGNGGEGGTGGERIPASTFTCSGQNPGFGGKANPYSNVQNKIFFGGGGGAGHENNAGVSMPGGNGGGIVIIIADTIYGNFQTILANGSSADLSEDGAGGGGAGGAVLLDVLDVQNALSVNTSGGNGGNINNVGPNNCNGPGGGGGGGILWMSLPSIPATISHTLSGGAAGSNAVATQTNCTVGGTNGATGGNIGSDLTDLSIPFPQNASGIDTQTACDSFTWIDGITYQSSNNTAVYTISGGAQSGCDSIVSLDLTITTIDTTINLSGNLLTANQASASYQWLECPSFTPIAGETAQSLNVTSDGQYAVAITLNGCTDTSSCWTVSSSSNITQESKDSLKVYPNPTNGLINIELGVQQESVEISVVDILGKEQLRQTESNCSQIEMSLDLPSGIYFIVITSSDFQKVVKIELN
jgi:hypothetical protein